MWLYRHKGFSKFLKIITIIFISLLFFLIINTTAAHAADYRGVQPTTSVEIPDGGKYSSCPAVAVIGWLVCPAVSFLAWMADGAFAYISSNFLEINVTAINTGGPAQQAWSMMRSIANVLFAIGFIIIIFSQLTSIGLDNYGIKKLLPKLIIIAILVNISFYICQIAVDVSNIIGYSFKETFSALANNMTNVKTSSVQIAGPWLSGANNSMMGNVAAGVFLLTGLPLFISLAALIPIIIAAAVALTMVLFLLIARQGIVILLIVISPLAFVCYLLPNTAQLFAKWKKLFTSMLLLFPIVGLIFGVSTMASKIIEKTLANGSNGNFFGAIVAMAVLVLPLFVIPPLLKKALSGVGNIGAVLNKIGAQAGKNAAGLYSNSNIAQYQQSLEQDKLERIRNGNYQGDKIHWISHIRSRANRGLNESAIYNKISSGHGAQRSLEAQAQNRKEADELKNLFGGNSELAKAWAHSGGNKKHARYASLDNASKEQFDKLVATNQHKKAASHFAAAKMLSENGLGSGDDVYRAIGNAKARGASVSEATSVTMQALESFKSVGRGDSYADLKYESGLSPNMNQQERMIEGWGAISPSQINQYGLTGAPSGLDGYKTYLSANSENLVGALNELNQMSPISRSLVTPVITEVAQSLSGNSSMSLQQAYAHFGATR